MTELLSKIKLTDLNPSKNEVRKIDEEGLRILEKSMSQFGIVSPIIINLKDGANRIISGHQRYDVLLNKYMDDEIGDEELNLITLGDIGWVFRETNLTLNNTDEETELSIGLNTHQGQFIKSKLEETLTELQSRGLDIELTGFGDVELNNMKINLEPLEPEESVVKGTGDESKIKTPVLIKCPHCGHEFEN